MEGLDLGRHDAYLAGHGWLRARAGSSDFALTNGTTTQVALSSSHEKTACSVLHTGGLNRKIQVPMPVQPSPRPPPPSPLLLTGCTRALLAPDGAERKNHH